MKKKKLIPALVLTLTLLCGITIGASATGGLQEITAYLNSGITVTLPLFQTYELKFEVKPDGKTNPSVRIFDAILDAE